MRELEIAGRRERYVLLERLGRGGAAETWRARRETDLFAQQVCVKRPLGQLGPTERRALLEEARVMARIEHANVVSLLDVVEERSGGVFLVLELVSGLDLRVLTRAQQSRAVALSPDAVGTIGVRLCRALAAAQRAVPGGLVHRDVTPHNVLLSCEGNVKLADFGVARAFDRERWTRTGLVKGKLAYVSPEQARGEQLDVRSDLFALGVLLFELLCGRRPPTDSFPGASAPHGPAPGVFPAGVPPRLARVVLQFLSQDRDDRPASADIAARLLAASCSEQSATDELRRAVLRATRPGVRPTRPLPALAAAGV